MLIPSPGLRPAGEHVPADVARLRILEEHRGLRRLLEAGIAIANRSLAGDEAALTELPTALINTRQAFHCHLNYEEGLLLPILEDDVPVGPWRATALLEEHRRQRAELDALCLGEQTCSWTELSARFGALVQALLTDMEEEERHLITPDVIRDDGVVIDQTGG